MNISKSQVVNLLAIISAVSLALSNTPELHMTHLAGWVFTALTVIAGVSRSLMPALSGLPGNSNSSQTKDSQ